MYLKLCHMWKHDADHVAWGIDVSIDCVVTFLIVDVPLMAVCTFKAHGALRKISNLMTSSYIGLQVQLT